MRGARTFHRLRPAPICSLVLPLLLFLMAVALPLCAQTGGTEFPLPLVVDGRTVAEIPALIADDETLFLEAADLADAIEEELDPSVTAILRTLAPGERVSPERLAESSLDVRLDMENLVVQVHIPPELRRTRDISLRGVTRDPAGIPVSPAPFSVILNADTGVRYGYEPDTFAADLVLEPAVNIYSVAVETRAAVRTGDENFLFDYARASWDIPGGSYRVQAGDLAWRTAELDQVSRLLGASFFRRDDSFRRQRRDLVLLDGIFLPWDGEVIVEVNGRRIRRLVLPAGSYRLTGVRLSSGINIVRVIWTGTDGLQEVELIIPADTRLLDPGELDAGVAAGVADRDPDRPVVASYQRIGVTDTLTMGFRQGVELAPGYTGDDEPPPDLVQQIDAGVELLTATPVGTFTFGTDVGIGPEERQTISVPVRYTWIDARAARYRNLDVTGRWRRSVDRTGALLTEDITAGAAMTFITGTRMALTPRLIWGYDLIGQAHRVEGLGSLRTAAGSRTTVRVDAGFVYDTSLFFVASVNISAAFPERRQNLFLQQNLVTQDFGAFWNRYHDETVDPWDYRASVQVPADPERIAVVSGGAGYRNELLQSSFNHVLSFTPAEGNVRNSSSLRAQSAVVHADGATAVTRPISDSFIIISPADHVADHTFILRRGRPGQETTIQGGPVLLGGVRSHQPQEVSVEMEDFDPSIDADELAWLVQPTYRSGTHIRIDPVRRIHASGILVDQLGRPVPLLLGTIDDGTAFFTDEAGYFELSEILPGSYVLRVEGRRMLVYDLTLEANGEQRRDLGTLQPRDQ